MTGVDASKGRVERRLPYWTPLPSLKLIGAGTPMVESLDHYAHRMASRCGLSRAELAALLMNSDHRKSGMHTRSVGSWIGPKSGYKRLLFPLMELTGQADLFRGTFYSVENVFGREGMLNSGRRGGGRRWCPRCYLEWVEGTSVEPLVWCYSMLSSCPIHRVTLEASCRVCGNPQSYERPYHSRRTCARCSHPLGHEGSFRSVGPFQAWVDQRLVSFTEYVSSLDEQVNVNSLRTFATCLKARFKGGDDIPKTVRMHIQQLGYQVGNRTRTPSISAYLNLAAFQGITIEAILSSPAEAATRSLFDRSKHFTKVPLERGWATKQQKLGKAMELMLANTELLLPPLTALWKQFGVAGASLQNSHPELHQEYLERYQEQGSHTRVNTTLHRRAFAQAVNTMGEGSGDQRQLEEAVDMIVSFSGVDKVLARACVVSASIVCQVQRKHLCESDRLALDRLAEIWLSPPG